MLPRSWIPIAFVLAACGEEEPPPPPPRPAQANPGGGGAGRSGTGTGTTVKMLTPQIHIEDRVTDPAEKASLRRQFKDRDFAVEQNNRDPFQSFVVIQPGMSGGDGTKIAIEKTKKCTRDDQMIASNYSYAELKLVGIVAQGTQRKVLMMDAGNLGHIIKRGDCVGKERAFVRDIGAGYVTFVLEPDDTIVGAKPTNEEHSVQLYPNQVPIMALPNDAPAALPTRPVAPVVAPPSLPPRGSGNPIVEQPPALPSKP